MPTTYLRYKMDFCPKCKSLMIPKEGVLRCSCGYTKKETVRFTEQLKKDIIEVVDEDGPTGNVEVPIVCWNCGHRGVYFWMQQMRAADEPPTRFYKCKKCKKVWRSGK